jgi:hypothetical protein
MNSINLQPGARPRSKRNRSLLLMVIAFAKAAECWLPIGELPEGTAWRGWLRLSGLGFPPDREEGLAMIRKAVWDEPRLAIDWLPAHVKCEISKE